MDKFFGLVRQLSILCASDNNLNQSRTPAVTILRQAHPSMFQSHRLVGRDTFEVRRLKALLQGRALRPSRLRAISGPHCSGDYLISSEKGIFRARGELVENVFPFPTFGLSIAGDNLYAAVPLETGPISSAQ